MPSVLPVLYAEDNPLDAQLTRSHFARHATEFALEIVRDAEEFLREARSRRHAVLLLDLHLPQMDGLEILKILAQEGIETPVVIVTGAGDPALASQALRLGAGGYVPKRNGYLDELPAHLREVIERRVRATSPGLRSRTPLRKLLLVERIEADAEVLARQLATCAPHFLIETTPSPDHALTLLTQAAGYDLVLCDRQVLASERVELITAARQQGLRLPFILLAEAGDEETVVAAFKLGASDYVLKPEHHYAELALRIDLAIDRHELTLANERAAQELAQRQRTLAALRESEKQLNLALEAGRIGLWSWEVGSGETHFSSRWKAQIGYADHEIRNDASEWESRCNPHDLEHLQAMTARYLKAPWPDFSVEYRMRHKDGTWRWFLLHADLEFGDEGRPVRMLGSQIDVTALKRQQSDFVATSLRLQQLSRRLLEVQETERRHLARELHDEIGQVLTVAKIHLQSAALETQAPKIIARIQEPIELLDRLLAQVRSLSLDLRPPLLDDLGLVHALHWLIQQHQTRSNLPRVHIEADPAMGRCDPTLETACFRIAQEALTNALRHSQAANVYLSLGLQATSLRLAVRDDGLGFDASAARTRAEGGASLGILGMHERALLAGGALTLLSSPGRGTEIEAVFPLQNSQKSR